MENPFSGGSGKKKKTRGNNYIPNWDEGYFDGILELKKDGYTNEIKEITSVRNRNETWRVFLKEGYLILKEGVYRLKKVDKGYEDGEGNFYELNV